MATNAVQHGTPPLAVRAWHTGHTVTYEVADCGYWDPPADLAEDPDIGLDQFGLRLVRCLCDRMLIRTGYDGTRVRLSWLLS